MGSLVGAPPPPPPSNMAMASANSCWQMLPLSSRSNSCRQQAQIIPGVGGGGGGGGGEGQGVLMPRGLGVPEDHRFERGGASGEAIRLKGSDATGGGGGWGGGQGEEHQVKRQGLKGRTCTR